MSNHGENLYPSSTQHIAFSEPKGQRDEREKEKEAVLASLPVISDVVERLKKRIAFYDSVDSVPKEILSDPNEFMHRVAINKGMKEEIKKELEGLEQMLTDYK